MNVFENVEPMLLEMLNKEILKKWGGSMVE
jgi:hypothetical protein